jgi:hypothetical protein
VRHKTGGTVKRLARKTFVQNPSKERMMTSRQLYKWTNVKILLVTFEYCAAVEDHSREIIMLGERFRKS